MVRTALAVVASLVLLLPGIGRGAPTSSGPLRVSKVNPRYFTDGSGKAIYLTGINGGWELQDDAWAGYSAQGTHVKFDFDRYLNLLTTHHLNYIRLWQIETTRWDKGSTDMLATPMPFLRTGPGNALDGKLKFDLTKFNPEYFARLRSRVRAAGDRGIYVAIMLFEGFSCVHPINPPAVAPGANPWFGHPYNVNNNINGIDADANGDGLGVEFHSLKTPAVTELQKAYVRMVIDTVNDLDNVLYEITNESVPDSKDWQYDMIKTIKQYEAGKPKQHPVVMSAYWPGETNPALFASPADAIEPQGGSAGGDYENNPPPATGKKVIIADSDHINWHTKDPQFIWKNFLRGNNPQIIDERLVGFDWVKGMVTADDGTYDSIRWAMGYTRMYADRMNLIEMTPNVELSSTRYCLAKTGAEYLIYQPNHGAFSVKLTAGRYAFEWFNPSTGKVVEKGVLTAAGGEQTFKPPLAGTAVLYLKAE